MLSQNAQIILDVLIEHFGNCRCRSAAAEAVLKPLAAGIVRYCPN